MSSINLSLEALQKLAETILIRCNTCPENARQVAAVLVAAEADGQKGHGASRIPSYSAQADSGKVDGFATPEIINKTASALTIDAKNGFAYPALNLAFEEISALAAETGIAAAAITRSHHAGVAGLSLIHI